MTKRCIWRFFGIRTWNLGSSKLYNFLWHQACFQTCKHFELGLLSSFFWTMMQEGLENWPFESLLYDRWYKSLNITRDNTGTDVLLLIICNPKLLFCTISIQHWLSWSEYILFCEELLLAPLTSFTLQHEWTWSEGRYCGRKRNIFSVTGENRVYGNAALIGTDITFKHNLKRSRFPP